MTRQASQPGTMLRLSTGALAALAAAKLMERGVSSPEAGPRGFSAWKEHLSARVGDLADALEASRPEVFLNQVLWANSALHARGVPVEDFRAGLDCLASVLEQELPPGSRESAVSCVRAALEALNGADTAVPPALAVDSLHGKVAAEFLLATLEGNRRRATALIEEAASNGVSARDLYLHVFLPVQREVGRMWQLNEITVAEEHFVTTTTLTAMSILYPRLARRPSRSRTVVAGAVEGDSHELGPRMVADFLEMDGWRAIYLGANVPSADLAMAMVDFDAELLALGVSLAAHLHRVPETIDAVRRASAPRVPRILVGGGGFAGTPERWRELGADGIAGSADEAVSVANRICGVGD